MHRHTDMDEEVVAEDAKPAPDPEPVDMRQYSRYVETPEDKRAHRAIFFWTTVFLVGSAYLLVQAVFGAVKGENPLAYSTTKLLELRMSIETTIIVWLSYFFG